MKPDLSTLKIESFASDYLSECLRDGTLVLFLGAGTSSGFGLPDWLSLINELRLHPKVNLPPLSTAESADALQLAADQIQSKIGSAALMEEVRKILYKDINDIKVSDLFDKHLLVAIASLLMGSKRGHVSRVVTLNYDNMLEWFLSIFGFVVKTVHQLPALEGSEDVTIYHIHGFLPHPKSGADLSSEIILGMESIDKRLDSKDDPWYDLTRHLLNSGICLFIGMSPNTLSDRALGPLLVGTAKGNQNTRPTGFWLLLNPIDEAKESEFERKNIVPIVLKSAGEVVEFIFEIAQKAQKKSSI